MKPRTPFVQKFNELPDQLPLYPIGNALLPGGELPLELKDPVDLVLFIHALRSDQLIGLVQAKGDGTYDVGCAGRIRQYRERKDGRLNVMLTGVCRFRITERIEHEHGFTLGNVDWTDYEHDYDAEDVHDRKATEFKSHLRDYFVRHSMQVDWKTLDELPIEQVINNLVLIMNFDTDTKQRLLEALTLEDRLALFSDVMNAKAAPMIMGEDTDQRVN